MSFMQAQIPKQITVDERSFIDLNGDGILQPYEDTRLSNNRRTEDLISRLTINEKISLVMGTGMAGFEMLSGFENLNPIVEAKDYLIPGAAGTTTPLLRHGLPAVNMADGPAGVRINVTRKNDTNIYYGTGFPIGTALASTWDTELVEQVGKAISSELSEYGIDIHLAPALNIMRNPLCGRNFEYYSEDPLIAGKTAAAMTRGTQQDGIGVSLKHFAANNSEKNAKGLNVNVSQRALREIYLRGFELAVKEANPVAIMSSFNMLNGPYTSANYDLLTTILRDEWGFKGIVLTDWFGGYSSLSNLIGNQSNDLGEHNAVKQIKAGNDLLMPGVRPQVQDLRQGIADGSFTERDLDVCVKRVLNMIFSSPRMNGHIPSNKPDLKAHAELVRQAASESMVLFENKGNTLPLSSETKKIGLFGSQSYHFIVGGTGSGDVNKAYTVSLNEGLTNAGYRLDKKVEETYTSFVAKEIAVVNEMLKKNPFMPIPLMLQPELKESIIKESAKANDIAIITLGRSSGETADRNIEADFNLTQEEQKLISEVSKAYHAQGKKVVVIINVGGVIETASWKDKTDAILLAWLPGQEAGNSVTDILSGKVNPSGKLPMTFPVKYDDIPFSSPADFQGLPIGAPTEVMYKEGIYVGYRYFNTFGIKPAYEFGYGLSYTTFDYSNLRVNDKEFNNEIYITVDVKNTGSKAGKDVVQLYLTAPKGQVDKPTKELKAFTKTKLLQPGEIQTVYLRLTGKDLASFNPEVSAWVADKGIYTIGLGTSSLNIRQTGTFNLKEEKIVERVNNVLNNLTGFEELKPTR
jgi:beta-glucosidase